MSEYQPKIPIDVYAPSDVDQRTASELFAEAASLKNKAIKRRMKDKLDRGEELHEHVNALMSLTGMMKILTDNTSVEDTLKHVMVSFGKTEEWLSAVKSRDLYTEVRKEAVKLLRDYEDDLPILKELLENDLTSYADIRSQDNLNNQIKYLHKTITVLTRINDLESRVAEVERREATRDVISYLMYQELLDQKGIVKALTEQQIYSGSDKDKELVKAEIAYLETEVDKIKHLLKRGVPKVDISKLLDINYRTLLRRIDKIEEENK